MILKNGKELMIRKAMVNDAPYLIKYLNAVGGESDNLTYGLGEFQFNEFDEKAFICSLNKNSGLFLGLIDDEIVSVGSLMTESKLRLSHNSSLGISVRKNFWNLGIAHCMLEAMIKFAKETKEIKNIRLEVRSDNVVAFNLYKQMGFEEIGIVKRVLKVNDQYFDNIIMCLYL